MAFAIQTWTLHFTSLSSLRFSVWFRRIEKFSIFSHDFALRFDVRTMFSWKKGKFTLVMIAWLNMARSRHFKRSTFQSAPIYWMIDFYFFSLASRWNVSVHGFAEPAMCFVLKSSRWFLISLFFNWAFQDRWSTKELLASIAKSNIKLLEANKITIKIV